MAWNKTNPCCRYAACPYTEEVEGVGLQTSLPEADKGFCENCWELLYGSTPSRWSDPPGHVHDGGWSAKFVCCVEPDCPNTKGRVTDLPHASMGFCEACYRRYALRRRTCSECG